MFDGHVSLLLLLLLLLVRSALYTHRPPAWRAFRDVSGMNCIAITTTAAAAAAAAASSM